MINRKESTNEDIKYRIKKIEDNLVTIVQNNNNERYEKIIIHFNPQTKEQMEKIKEELWDLRLDENINDDMVVDLKNNFKIPHKIIDLIPDTYLVNKIIEILYSNWGEIIDLRKVEYIK